MNKKFFVKLNIFLVIVGLGLACYLAGAYVATRQYEQNHLNRLPSVQQVQHYLNQLDPDDPIIEDGKLGRETQRKWDRLYCDQCANESMKESR